jgi:hypothetical protein
VNPVTAHCSFQPYPPQPGLEATQGKLFIEVPGVAEVTVST